MFSLCFIFPIEQKIKKSETWSIKIITNTYDISAHIERQRSIKIEEIFALHYGHFWHILICKYCNFRQSSPKLTVVRPKTIPWRSNQEWRSICADTVTYIVHGLLKIWTEHSH